MVEKMTELEQLRQKIKAMREKARQELDNARYFFKSNSVPTYTHIQVCRYKVDVLNDVVFILNDLLYRPPRFLLNPEEMIPPRKNIEEGGGAG